MNDEDEEKINWALEITEMKQPEDEKVSSLSEVKTESMDSYGIGTEYQGIILDEPTTYLDIKYQREILEIVEN